MSRTLIAAALLLGAATVSAQDGAATGNPVLRIVPQGSDGSSYFYNVQCIDQRSTSVQVTDDTNETCVHPLGGEKQCKVGWRLRDAAKVACGG